MVGPCGAKAAIFKASSAKVTGLPVVSPQFYRYQMAAGHRAMTTGAVMVRSCGVIAMLVRRIGGCIIYIICLMFAARRGVSHFLAAALFGHGGRLRLRRRRQLPGGQRLQVECQRHQQKSQYETTDWFHQRKNRGQGGLNYLFIIRC